MGIYINLVRLSGHMNGICDLFSRLKEELDGIKIFFYPRNTVLLIWP